MLRGLGSSFLKIGGARRSAPQGKTTIRQASGFLEKYSLMMRLNQLKKAIDKNPDQRTLLEFVKVQGKVSPREALLYIERGWQTNKIPVNDQYMKEYIKAAVELKKLDSLNMGSLLAMYNKSNLASESNNAYQALGSSIGTAGIAGSSPTEPLFVSQSEKSWKSHAWGLAKTAVSIFLVISLISTLTDEKGPGPSILFGKNSAVHQVERSDKRFDDVVGIDEAKTDLVEIVQYLKDPKKFTRLGGRLPKGVLLTGPPGTGKTLLARAIAGEAGVPFFYTSGSEFEEMYVGVGAKRVRELFEAAKQNKPCIIFIDEIDAVGGKRHVKDQNAMKMTLNQLLVEMDGFEQNNGVIVIGATNFPDSLDNALIRPGRFDKHVDVPMPDIGGREAILELYGKKIPLDEDVDLGQLARGTPGFSGADLFNLMNQAALKASVEGMRTVSMQALEYAKDKIMMGAERKSAVISPETMKVTAFHEAGHALVALKTDGSDPIHKATIMPRGRALGMVMQLPDGDQTSMSRKQMLARLDILMGGRVAEELIFGVQNVTSGASSDLQQATRLAHAMVTKYGLSTKIGVVFIDDKAATMQKEVDAEVHELLQSAYARAKHLIESHRHDLTKIAEGLMEYESLSGGEIVDLLKGKKPNVTIRSQKPSRVIEPIPLMQPKDKNTHGTPVKQPLPLPTPLPAKAPMPPANADKDKSTAAPKQ